MDSGTPIDAHGTTDVSSPLDSGPVGCASDAACDDHIDCTADTCTTATGACHHVVTPALCAAGESCNPMTGCMMGRACAADADCADTDACTTMERCDPAARVCTFIPLDGDRDGDPPRVCGGTDCDDSRASVHGGAAELCDMVDNDCNGAIDDGLASPGACTFCLCRRADGVDPSTCYNFTQTTITGLMCTNASAIDAEFSHCAATDCSRACEYAMAFNTCACPGGLSFCNDDGFSPARCVDQSTDPADCGHCGNRCPSGSTCSASTCRCPGGGTACSSGCVDTNTDNTHCGDCTTTCVGGTTCTSGHCVCPAGLTQCDGAFCADLTNDQHNCGGCGIDCGSAGMCSAGLCTYSSCPTTATCGGRTVCTFYDPRNCGSCGMTCAMHGADAGSIGPVCVRGICGFF